MSFDLLNKKPPDSRWAILGGLRFALALTVLSVHMLWFTTADNLTATLLPLGGTAAVLGFLVISGYSIAHSFQHRPAGYFTRRFFRIYPLYAAAVLFSLLPCMLAHGDIHVLQNTFFRPSHLRNTLGNLLFLQTFLVKPAGNDTVVWTLAVEVACYALAPLLIRFKSIFLYCLMILSAIIYCTVRRDAYPDMHYGLPLLMLAWAWLAGFAFHQHQDSHYAAPAVILGIATVLFLSPHNLHPLGCSTVIVSTVIVATARTIRLPAPARIILSTLGDLSYPLYLFHLPTMLFAWGVLHWRSPAALWALVFALSSLALMADNWLKKRLANKVTHRSKPSPTGIPLIELPTAAQTCSKNS